jgi:hypothetical protein
LTRQQQELFLQVLQVFLACLQAQRFEPGLRIKRVQGRPDVWEMTWAPNGRATFTYGAPKRPGDTHVVWRRIGTHDIFREP